MFSAEDAERKTHRIWKLIPVKVEGALSPSQSLSEIFASGIPPSYDGAATGQSSTHTRVNQLGPDEFGTVVTEVITVTTVKRYRVEDA